MDLDILRPLSKAEIFDLCSLYHDRYGSSSHYQYLLLYNQWKWICQLGLEDEESGKKEDWLPFRKTFYTHRAGDFRKYGTYVSIHFDTLQSVSFHSWQKSGEELFECLRETKLIHWSGALLTNVDLAVCKRVKELAISKGVPIERARKCLLLLLTHERALHLDVPQVSSEFYLAPLQEQHAELVHKLWINKKEGSFSYVKSLTIVNKTLGIYRTDNHEIVAWVFQNDFSGLGFLQVLPEYQRRGFGQILVAALSKQIAQSEEVDITAWIVVENFRSQGLLEKAGFVKSQLSEWIQLGKND